uniref:histone-lysine N-methyltransferase NSD2 isoform X2 n=1 Tax=Myxine glutinosa TaxID=7769 RepID=UPI00358EDF5A
MYVKKDSKLWGGLHSSPLTAQSRAPSIVRELWNPQHRNGSRSPPVRYVEGDLVWAKVTGYPWWPCMVAQDPKACTHTWIKGYGKYLVRQYHIRFLGCVEEHTWVSENSTLRFVGLHQIDELAGEGARAALARGERSKLLRCYPGRLRAQWEAGLAELVRAVSLTPSERIDCFSLPCVAGVVPLAAPVSPVGPPILPGHFCNDGPAVEDIPASPIPSVLDTEEKAGSKATLNTTMLAAMGSLHHGNLHGVTAEFQFDRDCGLTIMPYVASVVSAAPTANFQYDLYQTGRHGLGHLCDRRLSGIEEQARSVKMEYENMLLKAEMPTPHRTLSSGGIVQSRLTMFGNFCKQHQEKLASEHPDASEEEVNLILSAQWETLKEKERQHYKLTSGTLVSSQDSADGKRQRKPSKKFLESTGDFLEEAPKKKLKKEQKASCYSTIVPKKCGSPEALSTFPSVLQPSNFVSAILDNSQRPFCQSTGVSKISDSCKPLKKRSRTSAPEADLARTIVRGKLPTSEVPSAPESEVSSDGNTEGPLEEGEITMSLLKRQPIERGGGAAKKENVCQVCEMTGELLLCEGQCCGAFHLSCIGLDAMPRGKFRCEECTTGLRTCFVCKISGRDTKRCLAPLCGKFYHPDCVLKCNGCIIEGRGFRCPLHVCLNCRILRPDNQRPNRGRLMRCVRCPVAYHTGDSCVAAGTTILASNSIICPKHVEAQKGCNSHVNVSWCFVCSQGGKLLCCEACPAAFHAECLAMDMPEGSWFCNDCKAGKKPHYRDIVWVKVGSYRWWPAEIYNPRALPLNIQTLKHQLGEFPVRFFGSHDFMWTYQARIFPYLEGDKGSTVNRAKGINRIFKEALQEAANRFQELKMQQALRDAMENEKNQRKPHPYKHIKINKPVGKVQMHIADTSEIPRCNCKSTNESPCGLDSECLNRMLLYECHPSVCPAGARCQNQCFSKRLYPDTEVFRSEPKGWGLRTKVDIKKGEFVNEYVGELVDDEECRKRMMYAHERHITNFYMLTIDKDRVIDAGPKGNFSRFMNHSCQPNCETQKWTVNGDTRVGLFALKDIPAVTELTFNYNLDCLGNEKTACKCGAPNCSGFLGERPKSFVAGDAKKPKRKYRRRRPKPEPRREHDSECYHCGDGGELVMCDRRNCTKTYHLSCVRLTMLPKGKWECPRHHCVVCGEKTVVFCTICTNSYCKDHKTGALKHGRDGHRRCSAHLSLRAAKKKGVKMTVHHTLKPIIMSKKSKVDTAKDFTATSTVFWSLCSGAEDIPDLTQLSNSIVETSVGSSDTSQLYPTQNGTYNCEDKDVIDLTEVVLAPPEPSAESPSAESSGNSDLYPPQVEACNGLLDIYEPSSSQEELNVRPQGNLEHNLTHNVCDKLEGKLEPKPLTAEPCEELLNVVELNPTQKKTSDGLSKGLVPDPILNKPCEGLLNGLDSLPLPNNPCNEPSQDFEPHPVLTEACDKFKNCDDVFPTKAKACAELSETVPQPTLTEQCDKLINGMKLHPTQADHCDGTSGDAESHSTNLPELPAVTSPPVSMLEEPSSTPELVQTPTPPPMPPLPSSSPLQRNRVPEEGEEEEEEEEEEEDEEEEEEVTGPLHPHSPPEHESFSPNFHGVPWLAMQPGQPGTPSPIHYSPTGFLGFPTQQMANTGPLSIAGLHSAQFPKAKRSRVSGRNSYSSYGPFPHMSSQLLGDGRQAPDSCFLTSGLADMQQRFERPCMLGGGPIASLERACRDLSRLANMDALCLPGAGPSRSDRCELLSSSGCFLPPQRTLPSFTELGRPANGHLSEATIVQGYGRLPCGLQEEFSGHGANSSHLNSGPLTSDNSEICRPHSFVQDGGLNEVNTDESVCISDLSMSDLLADQDVCLTDVGMKSQPLWGP